MNVCLKVSVITETFWHVFSDLIDSAATAQESKHTRLSVFADDGVNDLCKSGKLKTHTTVHCKL